MASSGKKSYWLISAPNEGDQPSNKAFEQLSYKISREHNFGTVYRFNVPDLRVGTLDNLMSLSDDLNKIDQFVETVTRKIGSQLINLLDGNRDSTSIHGADPETYVTHFAWDEAKFPVKSSTRDLAESINEQVQRLDEEFRAKIGDYQTLSHQISSNERAKTGNLMTRDLLEIVSPGDLINTEYLTTLLVVVPNYAKKQWLNSYERLTNFVIPRSSKTLVEDQEFSLCTVTLFRKVASDFKNAAREQRFIVREFNFTAETFQQAKEGKEKLLVDQEQAKGKIIRWCKTNFAEAFVGWIHVKAIRVFVESILRYGLPANFQAMLVLPNKKEEKRLRKLLENLYAHLSSSAMQGGDDDNPIVGIAEKFYPYVYFPVNVEIVS